MITEKWMQRKPRSADQWLSDEAPRGAGRFLARITPSGERLFYFRYAPRAGKQARHPIGLYDPSGRRGLTLAHARDRAGELSKLYRTGVRDIREFEERRIREEMTARQAAEEARRRAELAAKAGSLRALLQAYWKHLEHHGKGSAADVRRLLSLHVIDAYPDLVNRRAADLGMDDFLPVIASLVGKRKGRTADKVRSFMRSAYALALRAKADASLLGEFSSFALQSNPVAAIAAMPQYNRTLDRSLTEPELREYLLALDTVENGVVKAALIAALYLGGQRAKQLLRAKPADVDLYGGVIRLRDPKGRRQQPRIHDVPITDRVAEIFAPLMKQNGEAPILFSTDGKRACAPDSLSSCVSDLAKQLLAAKKIAADFDFRDLRRTCETHLARLGVSTDHRAEIQSHGLGGVQKRSYDRHHYMPEKRAALEKWGEYLDSLRRHSPADRSGNVIRLRKRA